MKTMEQLGDEICKYCPYDCRGEDFYDRCDEAYANYIEENHLENELILEETR